MRSSLGVSWLRRSRVVRWLGAPSVFLAVARCGLLPAHAQSPTESNPDARSASPPHEHARVILLVRTRGDDGVMARVRAELSQRGWRILELRPADSAGHLPLARVAAAENVRAAVRFDAAGARVEVWTSGAAGEVEEALTTGADGDELELSYRVTETLRARGLEFEGPSPSSSAAAPVKDSSKPPPRTNSEGAPAPTPSTAAVVVPDARGLWIDAGAGFDPALGALSPAATAWLGARLEFHPRWSAGAFASIPLIPQRLSASEGSAEIATLVAGVAADFAWLRSRHWRARAGLGVAGAWSSMHGDAAAGYVSEEDAVSAVMPFAEARGELALHPRFWLWLGAMAGVTFPELVVQFAEQERADYGRPALSFVLGLDVLAVPIADGRAP